MGKIESSLDKLATGIAAVSMLAAVVLVVAGMDARTGTTLHFILAGAALLQGLTLYFFFLALAEIIKLLRNIAGQSEVKSEPEKIAIRTE